MQALRVLALALWCWAAAVRGQCTGCETGSGDCKSAIPPFTCVSSQTGWCLGGYAYCGNTTYGLGLSPRVWWQPSGLDTNVVGATVNSWNDSVNGYTLVPDTSDPSCSDMTRTVVMEPDGVTPAVRFRRSGQPAVFCYPLYGTLSGWPLFPAFGQASTLFFRIRVASCAACSSDSASVGLGNHRNTGTGYDHLPAYIFNNWGAPGAGGIGYGDTNLGGASWALGSAIDWTRWAVLAMRATPSNVMWNIWWNGTKLTPTLSGGYSDTVTGFYPLYTRADITADLGEIVIFDGELKDNAVNTVVNNLLAAYPPVPTAAPTAQPTAEPTVAPSAVPTAEPSAAPTATPTAAPTPLPPVGVVNYYPLDPSFWTFTGRSSWGPTPPVHICTSNTTCWVYYAQRFSVSPIWRLIQSAVDMATGAPMEFPPQVYNLSDSGSVCTLAGGNNMLAFMCAGSSASNMVLLAVDLDPLTGNPVNLTSHTDWFSSTFPYVSSADYYFFSTSPQSSFTRLEMLRHPSGLHLLAWNWQRRVGVSNVIFFTMVLLENLTVALHLDEGVLGSGNTIVSAPAARDDGLALVQLETPSLLRVYWFDPVHPLRYNTSLWDWTPTMVGAMPTGTSYVRAPVWESATANAFYHLSTWNSGSFNRVEFDPATGALLSVHSGKYYLNSSELVTDIARANRYCLPELMACIFQTAPTYHPNEMCVMAMDPATHMPVPPCTFLPISPNVTRPNFGSPIVVSFHPRVLGAFLVWTQSSNAVTPQLLAMRFLADGSVATSTPTAAPTAIPTAAPTAEPTSSPTAHPTASPTPAPTHIPCTGCVTGFGECRTLAEPYNCTTSVSGLCPTGSSFCGTTVYGLGLSPRVWWQPSGLNSNVTGDTVTSWTDSVNGYALLPDTSNPACSSLTQKVGMLGDGITPAVRFSSAQQLTVYCPTMSGDFTQWPLFPDLSQPSTYFFRVRVADVNLSATFGGVTFGTLRNAAQSYEMVPVRTSGFQGSTAMDQIMSGDSAAGYQAWNAAGMGLDWSRWSILAYTTNATRHSWDFWWNNTAKAQSDNAPPQGNLQWFMPIVIRSAVTVDIGEIVVFPGTLSSDAVAAVVHGMLSVYSATPPTAAPTPVPTSVPTLAPTAAPTPVCQTGYVSTSGSAMNCTACTAGRFAASGDATVCSDCARHHFSNASGASSCDPCANGTYAPFPAATTCLACTENTVCPCAPGEWMTISTPFGGGISTALCVVCANGTIVNGDGVGTGCLQCGLGTYNPTNLGTACTACANGTYASSPGQSACFPCTGAVNSSTASSCVCNAGFDLVHGQGCVVACAPTEVRDEQGVCGPCALGWIAVLNNATQQNECAPCPAGTFWLSNNTCAPCANGTYNPAPGSAACYACGPHTQLYSATTCTCADGYELRERVGCALPCVSPYYVGADFNCTRCPLGQVLATARGPQLMGGGGGSGDGSPLPTCQNCSAGQYVNGTGNACLSCNPGSFSAAPGSTECAPCEPGRFNNASGASACLPCDVNAFADMAGSTQCTPCPHGAYANSTGSTACHTDPTPTPSAVPTSAPSAEPTAAPSAAPTAAPTAVQREPVLLGVLNETKVAVVVALPLSLRLANLTLNVSNATEAAPCADLPGWSVLQRFDLVRSDGVSAAFDDFVELSLQLEGEPQRSFVRGRDLFVCPDNVTGWIPSWQYVCSSQPTAPARITPLELVRADVCHATPFAVIEPEPGGECATFPRKCKDCTTGFYGCFCQATARMDSDWGVRVDAALAFVGFFLANVGAVWYSPIRIAPSKAEGEETQPLRRRPPSANREDSLRALLLSVGGVILALAALASRFATKHNDWALPTQTDLSALLIAGALILGFTRVAWFATEQCTGGYSYKSRPAFLFMEAVGVGLLWAVFWLPSLITRASAMDITSSVFVLGLSAVQYVNFRLRELWFFAIALLWASLVAALWMERLLRVPCE